MKATFAGTESSGTKWGCGNGCCWDPGVSHLFPSAPKAFSVPILRTWKPSHLPPCCLASVWFGVCLTSILHQTGSFSRTETSLVFFVLFSLLCCNPPQGPVSPTRQSPGLDSLSCVLWFLPGAPKGQLGLAPDHTWFLVSSEWTDHGILQSNALPLSYSPRSWDF